MKFNVDGASMGQSREVRIKGSFKNHSSDMKIIFSEAFGLVNSNLVEVLGVKKAINLFAQS
ncbi:hypothetical protein PTKIN_Ptkin16aG0068300 [Pterospermum kingtungense]